MFATRVRARQKDVKGYVNAMRPGWLGNPYSLSEYPIELNLALYEDYLRDKLAKDSEFAHRFDSLIWRNIGCTCPLDSPCHVDVIINVLTERIRTNGLTRKSMIGKSNIEWTYYYCNHVEGCEHNCPYCYGWRVKHFPKQLWGKPRLVVNTLELLEKELPKHPRGSLGEITLCTTTDAFQPIAVKMTLKIIELFLQHKVHFRVLSKNKEILQGLPLYQEAGDRCWVGVTINTLQEPLWRKWSPKASPVSELLGVLEELHAAGIQTFLSLEPMLPKSNPCAVLSQAATFVKEIFVGKMNYLGKRQPDDSWVRKQVMRINGFWAKHQLSENGIRLLYKQEVRKLFPTENACYNEKCSPNFPRTLDDYFGEAKAKIAS